MFPVDQIPINEQVIVETCILSGSAHAFVLTLTFKRNSEPAREREKESANERKKSKGNWSKMLETRQLNGMKISFNMAR